MHRAVERDIIMLYIVLERGLCMDMEWLTPEEAGNLWGLKARRVQAMCSSGKVYGAVRKGRMWLIPKSTPKPIDGRTKVAKEQKHIML